LSLPTEARIADAQKKESRLRKGLPRRVEDREFCLVRRLRQFAVGGHQPNGLVTEVGVLDNPSGRGEVNGVGPSQPKPAGKAPGMIRDPT
jgi:hypothetical protein